MVRESLSPGVPASAMRAWLSPASPIAASLLAAVSLAATSVAVDEKPNFVLVMADDPKDEHDLIGQRKDLAAPMQAKLEAWQKSTIGSLNGRDY
jgi:hypothetical protein